MEVLFHKQFKKLYKKQPIYIQKRFIEQLDVFLDDPHDPTLNNHALRGTLRVYRSINVTGDIRAWYEVREDTVIFLKIGSHSELYG